MCLGKTITCRSCRRKEIRFYPGGKCGEVEPFQSWHTIRGHTRKVRRCHDCIQSHRRSQVRAQEDSIRDARRAKSLRQYFRRERRHTLPDEEVHLQSNGEYVLHSFDLVSEDGAEVEAVADQNSTAHLSSPQNPDGERDPAEINHWNDYQAGRRLYPFSDTATREEFLFFQSVAQRFPENETLALLMNRLEECFARQAHISSTGRSITEDDQQYMFESIRGQLGHQMAQLPMIEPVEPPTESFQAAIIDTDEKDEDYREPEAPEMSFYDWTLRSYEQDSTHNEGLSTQDALEQDLDNYDWYLRRYCTDLQVNDFYRRRMEIASRAFEFDHASLESVPFSQWLAIENRVRVRNGMCLITCPIQALDVFCSEIIWQQSQEVRDSFDDSRAQYFEQNRRDFYDYARDEKGLLIERLRGVTAGTLQMTLWVENNFTHLFNAQKSLDRVCQILTTRVAMEMEPTDEQWAEMLQAGQDAVKEIKEQQKQPVRENNWRNLYSQLTANWDHEFETQVGDVDDSDGDIHDALRVSSGFLGQEPQGESQGSDFPEPGEWVDLGSAQADPDWSSSEAEAEDDDYP